MDGAGLGGAESLSHRLGTYVAVVTKGRVRNKNVFPDRKQAGLEGRILRRSEAVCCPYVPEHRKIPSIGNKEGLR